MPPPSSTKKKSLSELKKHQDGLRNPLPEIVVITGLAGSGKTTLAATAFNAEVNQRLAMSADQIKQAPHLELKGAVWIAADTQATLALDVKRIHPEYVLDLQTLLDEANGNFSQALRDMHGYLGDAKENGATGFVVDTATSFGGLWTVPHFVDKDDSGNGFAGWASVGREYAKLLETGKNLKMRQIWLCQPAENKAESRAVQAMKDKKATVKDQELAQAKALTQGVGGGTNYIVPALAGNMFPPLLNAQCSMSSWLRAVEINGKKVRELLPFGGDGSQGKTRYEGILSEKEPPDLATMDRKILEVTGVTAQKGK